METWVIVIIVLVILSMLSSSVYMMMQPASAPSPSPAPASAPASAPSPAPTSAPSSSEKEQNQQKSTVNVAGPWKCLSDIHVPLRKNVGGDVECMSLNEKDCLWKSNSNDCTMLLSTSPDNLKPLVCGDMHKKQWGGPGYDDPNHWCARARTQL